MNQGEVEAPELFGPEQLVLCHDDEVGLRAVIAVDDTTLGPALGGVRFRAYASDAAGVIECQRLAAAMTLKNAVAELPFGGGKSVILKRGPVRDRAALMRRFGDFVARTGGAYLPGVDMGTTVEDLAHIGESGAVVSCAEEDPSPWTALGVAAAVRAAVEHVDGRSGIDGVRVLIQGAGHVGGTLARDLAADGAEVILADVNDDRADALAQELGGTSVPADAVLQTPCDVFAPCAVARVATPDTVGRLRCRIIAGAANDTLSDRSVAGLLQARGIVYVPDFVVNAGGVIDIHALRAGWDDQRLAGAVAAIGDRVREVLAEADTSGQMPLEVAEQRAKRILADARARGGARVDARPRVAA
ncbi:MAG TPA: Glu/Leu/Phe/Val dehydrogenase dimerization domain-containing protein [Solirubrobacteraceae bacterium]|jgi:leucine dehydrogenase